MTGYGAGSERTSSRHLSRYSSEKPFSEDIVVCWVARLG